jgi:hypothetical protein
MFVPRILSLLGCATLSAAALGQALSATDVASAVGLTKHTVAAAGLTGPQTQALLQRVHNNEAGREAFRAALERSDAAARAVREAELLVRADPTAESSRVQLRTCRQELSAARASLHQRKSELLQTAANTLPAAVVDRLRRIAESRRNTAVTELCIVARTASQWIRLRVALAAERNALASGQPVGTEVASLLQSARADTEVVAARTSLEANLPAVTTVIATFGQ